MSKVSTLRLDPLLPRLSIYIYNQSNQFKSTMLKLLTAVLISIAAAADPKTPTSHSAPLAPSDHSKSLEKKMEKFVPKKVKVGLQ